MDKNALVAMEYKVFLLKEGFYWKIFFKKINDQDSNPRFWGYYDNALTN